MSRPCKLTVFRDLVAFDPAADVQTNYFNGSLDLGTGLLGMHSGAANTSVSAMGCQVAWMRNHDVTEAHAGGNLYWYYIETSAGNYDWGTRFDEWAKYLNANSIKGVFTVYGTPRFYCTISIVDTAEGQIGGSSMPQTVTGIAAYKTYIYTGLSRANLASGGLLGADKHNVRAVEPWNEPNDWGGFWVGPCSTSASKTELYDSMARMTSACRSVVNTWNTANPTMPVEVWGTTSDQEGGWNASRYAGSWLNRYLRGTFGGSACYQYLHRVATHPYQLHWLAGPDAPPAGVEVSAVWNDVVGNSAGVGILNNLSSHLPVVMSEVGEELGATGMTETQMAAWYAQTMAGNIVASQNCTITATSPPILILYSYTGTPIGNPRASPTELAALTSVHNASKGTLYRIDRMNDDRLRYYTSNGLFYFDNIAWV